MNQFDFTCQIQSAHSPTLIPGSPATILMQSSAALVIALCCAAAQPVFAQNAPADIQSAKPGRLEFEVPSSIIGPTLDSIKRQIDSPSSSTKESGMADKSSRAVPASDHASQGLATTAGKETAPSARETAASNEPVPPKNVLPSRDPLPKNPSQSTDTMPSRNEGFSNPEAPRNIPPAYPPVLPKTMMPGNPATLKNGPAGKDTIAPEAAINAAPIETTALRFNDLKRLSKEEIVAAVTSKFTAYVLRGSERTIVLDFPTTQAQGRMFGRVILFVEREGTPKTRIMTVPEVKKWMAKNAMTIETLTMGNNIRVGEFARFFNTARFQGEPLTVEEQGLYDWLLQMQLLRQEEKGVVISDPEAIIVSVPQISAVSGCPACSVTSGQRAVVVEHELSHAKFATDTVYQNYVEWFWSQGMAPAVRAKFVQFLHKRGYEATIRELAANEMQAFLMHTPDPAIFNAAEVGMTETELSDLRRAFQAGLQTKPSLNPVTGYRLD